mgnify:CR=1 FL=1
MAWDEQQQVCGTGHHTFGLEDAPLGGRGGHPVGDADEAPGILWIGEAEPVDAGLLETRFGMVHDNELLIVAFANMREVDVFVVNEFTRSGVCL